MIVFKIQAMGLRALLIAFFACSLLQAKQHLLPSSLQNKPIYYKAVKQIDDLSCGYNALYNACKLEQHFGRANKHSKLTAFKAVCFPYLREIGENPRAASSNLILSELANRVTLQKFGFLSLNEHNKIEPLLSESIQVSWQGHLSKANLDALFVAERQKQAQRFMTSLKHELAKASGPHFIHFVCQVNAKGEEHGILLSVVKNSKGALALYIHDNMNSPIEERSSIKKYIDYVCKEFNIGRSEHNNRQQKNNQQLSKPGSKSKTIYLTHPKAHRLLAAQMLKKGRHRTIKRLLLAKAASKAKCQCTKRRATCRRKFCKANYSD